jgi:hypothetical protein
MDKPLTAASADSWALGTITGFGSVIVGGVRYDDSAAAIDDEDGTAQGSSALKLGMTVQLASGAVDSGSATASPNATAKTIRICDELVGPVSAIDTVGSTLTVIGQIVQVTASTVFDSSLGGGLTAVRMGDVLEVHGTADATTGAISATRIEPKTAAPSYRLRGVVSALDATAKTFRIGDALISYGGATGSALTGLANGQVVRVRVQTTPSAGAWVAIGVGSAERRPPAGIRSVHVEGAITSFTSSISFVVNGTPVDAGSAAFPDGSSGIVPGARVEVTGQLGNGVLVATKVEIEDKRDNGKRALEFHGGIASIDTVARSFVVRGVTVWYGGTVSYTGGTEADLTVGSKLEVRGVLSADKTRIEARKISFGA